MASAIHGDSRLANLLNGDIEAAQTLLAAGRLRCMRHFHALLLAGAERGIVAAVEVVGVLEEAAVGLFAEAGGG